MRCYDCAHGDHGLCKGEPCKCACAPTPAPTVSWELMCANTRQAFQAGYGRAATELAAFKVRHEETRRILAAMLMLRAPQQIEVDRHVEESYAKLDMRVWRDHATQELRAWIRPGL